MGLSRERPPCDAAEGLARERVLVAKVIDIGLGGTAFVLVVAFCAYAFGLWPSAVPIEEIPRRWHASPAELALLLQSAGAAGARAAEPWVCRALVLFAAVPIAAYLALAPALLRRRFYVYAALALTQAALLVLAASGLLR
jgi:hypothetical protein